ncbi:MAG: pyridoxamine 5'-phosphate oxidase family protein [Sediminibacterium magnilacihabitans]|jgi:nitroimidazol reductase NimA-like FMN-containing flavoprotein (pyridoxamine 5'-phosphate oxidase superfamily)|nr:pyridoxamine 5'-phosphate oxidase family protein [Sediminibacterium magnilacihabitans]PQV60299.1 hypothetical protein CLV53_109105 [Sediminibacterium magnilacihabitans]
MLGELSKEKIENILSSQVVGRLACSDGNQPYITPVTYIFDGKYIYGQSNEGKKLSILRKNPNVCFEVDVVTDMRNWQSVIIYGKFEELKDEMARNARAVLFEKVFSLMTSSTIHPHEHGVISAVDDSNRVKYVMYRIEISKITSRFEKQ